MITLKDILNLMDYTICDFTPEVFIQVLDHWSCAHYRATANGIELGGEPMGSAEDVMKLYVRSIEYEDGHCMIYLS